MSASFKQECGGVSYQPILFRIIPTYTDELRVCSKVNVISKIDQE